MSGLALLYYTVSYSTALPAIAVVAVACASGRERVLRSLLPFLASAALQLAAVALLRYQDAAAAGEAARLAGRRLYFLVESTLILSLPLVAHSVSGARWARARNIAAAAVFALCAALILSPLFAGSDGGTLVPRWGFYAYRAVFFSALLYSAALLAIGFFAAARGMTRTAAAYSFAAAVLLAWEMLHCELFPVLGHSIFPLSPACFAVFNVILIVGVLRGRIRESGLGTAAPAANPSREVDLSSISAREKEIAILLAAGRRNFEISAALFISESTVKTHIKSIYRKLGVRNRVQLVNLMEGRGAGLR